MKHFLTIAIILSLLAVNSFLVLKIYEKMKSAPVPLQSRSAMQNESAPTVKPSSTLQTVNEQQTNQPKGDPTPSPSSKAAAGKSESSAKPKTESAADTNYIYYLSDDRIKQAIQAGKSCVLNCDKTFILPLTGKAVKSDYNENDINKVVIGTPYEMVMSFSGLKYYKEDRTVSLEEAKEMFDFKELHFTVNFSGNMTYQYKVYIEQSGHTIDPVYSNNEKSLYDYSLKFIDFKVSDLDFTKPASLILEHKEGSATFTYGIRFEQYVR